MFRRYLSTNLNKINNISPTLNSKLILQQRINNGLEVYNGGLGENPLKTPNYLINKLKLNLDKKEYTNIEGTDVFQNAIKQYYPKHLNNSIVGNGLKELIFNLSLVWQKKIFLPAPCWVTYLEDMKKLNKDYYTIKCDYENNYKLCPDELEKSLRENNGQDSLLFLNSPNNPTGAVYNKNEYELLSTVFKKYNITVFCDEIYYNTSQVETISLSKIYDKCIVGSSLSKDWASGGWRFGWMLFPDKLKKLHQEMVSTGSIMYSCPTDFMNDVGSEALTNITNKEHFDKQRIFFKKIADDVLKEIDKDKKIIHSTYQGAWYMWFDLKNYSSELKLKNINNSQELTERLAEDIGLIVVPGSCFGIEGFTFRLSMIDENIHKGIKKMIEWLNR